MDPVVQAVLLVGVAGGVGGLVGGFFGSSNAGLFGAVIMGFLGGIAGASIARIGGAQPLIHAGQSFSYVYGAGSGMLLSFIVSASNRD